MSIFEEIKTGVEQAISYERECVEEKNNMIKPNRKCRSCEHLDMVLEDPFTVYGEHYYCEKYVFTNDYGDTELRCIDRYLEEEGVCGCYVRESD